MKNFDNKTPRHEYLIGFFNFGNALLLTDFIEPIEM